MKLTNDIRTKIIDAAIASTDIPKRREKLKADLKAFAKKLATEGLKRPIPQCILRIWEDPAARSEAGPYLFSATSVEVELEGYYYRNALHAKNDSYYDPDYLPSCLKLDDPVPARAGCIKIKLSGHPMEGEARALSAFHRDTNLQEDNLRAQLRSIVYAATTKDKLLKVWPEGERFIPPDVAKVVSSTALIPAETILDVNRKLGLSA